MSSISDLGNSIGFLYETLLDGTTITSVTPNAAGNVRNFLQKGSVNAPVSANRSAVATITVTAVAATGAFSAVNVSGVNQIASNVSVLTSNTTTEAQILAAAINAFTPATGLDYTAIAVANVIYLIEPAAGAGASNGVTPVVSVTSGTITTSVTAFAGGAPAAGVYDVNHGRLYWINASGTGTADSLSGAVDITKYITERPVNSPIPNLELTISANELASVNRYSSIVTIKARNEGGAARDSIEFINPVEFTENDLVYLESGNASENQDIVSTGNATDPRANIYLTSDQDFATDNNAILILKYKYSPSLGAIFVEVGRSTPSTTVQIQHNQTVYVDLQFGDDATAARQFFYPKVFQTADAAIAALVSGDKIVFRTGSYDITAQLFAQTNITATGDASVTLNGTTFLQSGIASGAKIDGSMNIICSALPSTFPDGFIMECNNLTVQLWNITGTNPWFSINIKGTLTQSGLMAFDTPGKTKCHIKWNRAVYSTSSAFGRIAFGGCAKDSDIRLEGDMYITANCNNIFSASKANLDYNARWDGNLWVDPGVTISAVCYSNNNLSLGGQASPYRVILSGELHVPTSARIFSAIGGGQFEFIGKIFTDATTPPFVISGDVGGITLPSYLTLTDCDVYAPSLYGNVIRLVDTISSAVLKNVRLYAAGAPFCIQGDVASCHYQSLGDNRATSAIGGNASNETGGTDIQVSALMRG